MGVHRRMVRCAFLSVMFVCCALCVVVNVRVSYLCCCSMCYVCLVVCVMYVCRICVVVVCAK